jgi:hypothetical protein
MGKGFISEGVEIKQIIFRIATIVVSIGDRSVVIRVIADVAIFIDTMFTIITQDGDIIVNTFKAS